MIRHRAWQPVQPPAQQLIQPSPTPAPSPQGYSARVTQPIGLIIRQEPNVAAAQIGGVEYNREVTILEDSPDGTWQKIRLGNVEGWVKGGNTQRLN
jgi:Bacterial SH3 domain